MISVHLDDIRRAEVSMTGSVASVVFRIGSYDRVALLVRTETQARILAEAINAGLADTAGPILTRRIGGA